MTRHLALAAALAAACGGSNNNKPDSNGGSGSDAGLTPDAMAQTMDVSGTIILHSIDDLGSGSAATNDFPVNPAAVTITSATPSGAGFLQETGTATSTGGFTVPVLMGAASYDVGIQFGSGAGTFPDFVVGNGTVLDFGQTFFGRLPLTQATGATPVTVNLTGLNPWGAADDLEIMSSNSGGIFFSPQTAFATKPKVGDVAIAAQKFDWSAQATQLIDSTQGDKTDVWQLGTATSGTDTYNAISAHTQITGFSIVDKTGGTLTAALTPVTQNETLTVAWKRSQYEALKGQVGPGATDLATSQFLLIDALPFAKEHGFYGSAPDLMEFLSPPKGSTDLAETFKYANPFTTVGATPFDEYVITRFDFNVNITAPAATSGTPVEVGFIANLPVDDVKNNATIAPVIGPVQNVKVAGMSVMSAAVTGAGMTPTVTWDAPTIGTPVGYSIVIDQAANHLGQTTLTEVGVLFSTGTTVEIPPGIITAGENTGYALIITAYATPGYQPTISPFSNGLPDPQTSMATAVFSP